VLAAAFVLIGKKVLGRHYAARRALFSIGVASIVFLFGNVLQPAVQFYIEGENPLWSLISLSRERAPGVFVLGLLTVSILPGILTGLAVLKGNSFNQRVAYGVIWAPLSLTLLDALMFYLSWNHPVDAIRTAATWNNVYFSLLSNVFGGAVGGFLIGAAVHLYSLE
jgi:hypothetical protein